MEKGKKSKNNPLFPVGCVIMASGLGKRFGGNKLMAEFEGLPLVMRAIMATEGLVQKLVVVTRHEEVAKLCRERNIEVILHALPYRSDTVRLGVEAIGEDVEGCIFLTGDQPLLRRETVAELIAHWETEPNCIWRAASQGQGKSPVLFPRWCFPELTTLPEGKGGNVVVKRHPRQVRLMEVEDARELWDVDTQEDLQELEMSNEK